MIDNTTMLAQMGQEVTLIIIIVGAIMLVGILITLVKCYQKVAQGTALVRNGVGGSRVAFTGIVVFPIIHKSERMDISVKRVKILRKGEEGLVCKDNLRADIEVAFFVRVNKTPQDVLRVAQSLGCVRASEESSLREFFDAKFSEALKTVGKKFDFVDLYEQRHQFKDEILKIIGTDLNGYVLDDAAIDFLEQTPLDKLNPDNILDAEGIKKITELTAAQQMLANDITRNKEKVITKQDVEARETILELERQQAEAVEKQAREVAALTSRERAEAEKIGHEERLKSERARIASDEEIAIAVENKDRQVLVAQRNKERVDFVERERVEKDRMLEATERERIVELAQIEKEKALELERRNIQEVIRDRVVVERSVVEEQQRIKDTEEFATADRAKQVAVTLAEKSAQESLVLEVQAADASRMAAEKHAERRVIEADAERAAAEKEGEAKKILAEATAAEEAALGMAEAQVMEAKAEATEKQGAVDASVAKLKFTAEAEGIEEKANAMKLFDGVGREHEEFKLQLNKEKDIELAGIDVHRSIAEEKAKILGEALKSANIDIVGGDVEFIDRIVNSVGGGKSVDAWVEKSRVLTDVKDTFFDGNGDFKGKLRDFIGQFGLESEDIKNLSIAALIGKLMSEATEDGTRSKLQGMLDMVKSSGLENVMASNLGLGTRNSTQ
ncbi:MAG: flotillin family protein [Planctomycetota bacterium]